MCIHTNVCKSHNQLDLLIKSYNKLKLFLLNLFVLEISNVQRVMFFLSAMIDTFIKRMKHQRKHFMMFIFNFLSKPIFNKSYLYKVGKSTVQSF